MANLAKAFKAAKRHLSDTTRDTKDKKEFICWALRVAMRNGKITTNEYWEAKSIINSRIEGLGTFNAWIENKYPKLAVAINMDRSYNSGRQMQITRKAWLDSLIKEFSQKG